MSGGPKKYDAIVVGAGPAGLSAAAELGRAGARTLVLDRDTRPGGQLVKQTHKFFGSEKQRAGTRGVEIARLLREEVAALPAVEMWLNSTVLGFYSDRVITVERVKDAPGEERREWLEKVTAPVFVLATGAAERFLPFPNNDLPGIYGAGAAQTLMNVHGVRPGRRVVMVGAGNIGLIVSYQLLQAGVEVAAIVEAAPVIGGYLVHAAKVRRAGVPILTSHTVKEAHGREALEGVTVWRLDEKWQPVPGTEKYIAADVLCLATGLSPLAELLFQAGCQMAYVPELGGHVPVHGEDLETSVPGVFVAGDVSGVEEASAAMVEGHLAGLGAAARLGLVRDLAAVAAGWRAELASLRAGPSGEKIRRGLAKLAGQTAGMAASSPAGSPVSPASAPAASAPAAPPPATSAPKPGKPGRTLSPQLTSTGEPAASELESSLPPADRRRQGPYAVIECFQEIPCDPCHKACRTGAIGPFPDINLTPAYEAAHCNGCALCVAQCPGLACFVVDENYSPSEALLKLPYEFLPLPAAGHTVDLLDRTGALVGSGRVVRVVRSRSKLATPVVWVTVPSEKVGTVRNIRVPATKGGAAE